MMKAKIILTYDDESKAEAVKEAVSPDNVEAPPYISIETIRSNTQVITYIECSGKLKSFISTIDDLLSCVSVAEKTFSVIDEMK